MTIQTIFNSAQRIEFERRRIVGQTISRSERLRVSERASSQAFEFKITPIARFPYKAVRYIIESIMNKDRFEETQVNIANTPGLWYITEYTGQCTPGQLAPITVSTWTNTTVHLANLPSVSTSTIIFKAGDWIQPLHSRYPYIVAEDVLKGAGTTATMTVHRPLITTENTTVTSTLLVGTATTLRLVVSELPTYQLVQKDWAEFTGDFTVIERII